MRKYGIKDYVEHVKKTKNEANQDVDNLPLFRVDFGEKSFYLGCTQGGVKIFKDRNRTPYPATPFEIIGILATGINSLMRQLQTIAEELRTARAEPTPETIMDALEAEAEEERKALEI